MPRPAKPPDRAKVLSRIASLEGKLARSPTDSTTAEASIEHAGLQIQYWRARQVLASLDTQDPDVEIRKLSFVESRKCTEAAAEWERRKADSAKLLIARQLEELAKKLDAQKTAATAIQGIATD